jgi:hypothetical protein
MDDEKQAMYRQLKAAEFPFGEGDTVYDVVEKVKGKIMLLNRTTDGKYVKINFVQVRLENNTTIKIGLSLFYKRFINITQIIAIKEYNNGDNWTKRFI